MSRRMPHRMPRRMRCPSKTLALRRCLLKQGAAPGVATVLDVAGTGTRLGRVLAVQRIQPKPFDRRPLGHGQAGRAFLEDGRRGSPRWGASHRPRGWPRPRARYPRRRRCAPAAQRRGAPWSARGGAKWAEPWRKRRCSRANPPPGRRGPIRGPAFQEGGDTIDEAVGSLPNPLTRHDPPPPVDAATLHRGLLQVHNLFGPRPMRPWSNGPASQAD
jgi:hypothetical protein